MPGVSAPRAIGLLPPFPPSPLVRGGTAFSAPGVPGKNSISRRKRIEMIQDDSRDWSDFTADFILASMLAFPVLGGIAGYGFRGPVTAGICAIVGSLVWYFMVRLM